MLKALYFPSTDISNPDIIKNALLLWDKVQTIVPQRPWQPRRLTSAKAFNEAVYVHNFCVDGCTVPVIYNFYDDNLTPLH